MREGHVGQTGKCMAWGRGERWGVSEDEGYHEGINKNIGCRREQQSGETATTVTTMATPGRRLSDPKKD